jgi:hypothetical protein
MIFVTPDAQRLLVARRLREVHGAFREDPSNATARDRLQTELGAVADLLATDGRALHTRAVGQRARATAELLLDSKLGPRLFRPRDYDVAAGGAEDDEQQDEANAAGDDATTPTSKGLLPPASKLVSAMPSSKLAPETTLSPEQITERVRESARTTVAALREIEGVAVC